MARAARVCCCTSFTCSYWPRARVLAETLRQAHPDWVLQGVLVDKPPPGFDLTAAAAGFDRIMMAESLAIPRVRAWLFKHDLVEACTAVKGQMLVELFAAGFDKVIYLDPDIAVFHGLDSIIDRLDSASIVLTPHQCAPNTDLRAVRDNELTSLRYGAYNLGFVAVRRDQAGLAFAEWWARHLYRACYDEVQEGLFTDQKYIDLVPGLFDGVYIERDPGCNLASWNLSQREVKIQGGAITVNGSALKFYHFTKIGAAGDLMTDRYAADNTEVFEIWNWNKRALKRHPVTGLAPDYWHYGCFSNGKPIARAIRLLYRQRNDLMTLFDDPYNVVGDSLYAWLSATGKLD